MLITSVLHILDKLQTGTKVSGAASSEGFQSLFGKEFAPAPGSPIEKAKEKLIEAAGPVRPKPGDFPAPTLASQRGIEEFMKVLEKAQKENRSPILDVFE